jgi:hypothetical protein
MPQQNLVSGTLSAADQQAVLDAIQTIRDKLPFLTGLSREERASLPKMGDRSVGFVQTAHQFAGQNVDRPGADFGMPEFTSDMELEAQLRPIEVALGQLSETFSDTMLALRSDLMVRSTFVYALMKVLGKASGAFDDMRQAMGQRFKRGSSKSQSGSGGGGGAVPGGGSGGPSGGGTGGTT